MRVGHALSHSQPTHLLRRGARPPASGAPAPSPRIPRRRQHRAAAARDYLLAQGVDPARIKVISYGKERPAMAGSNEESWAKNRRAATVLN